MPGKSAERERTEEVRWIGDEKSERAVLLALGCPEDKLGCAVGIAERWVRIPASKFDVVIWAIVNWGGELVSRPPS